jgi:DNA-binding transcriptional LysR family regulator
MQIERMKEFLELANTLNFSSAAEKLYISQATLSKHIHELEDELGAPLFKRSTRKTSLTELGIIVYPYAQRAVALQDEFNCAVKEHIDKMESSLSIGTIGHWHVEELNEIVTDFQIENSTLRLNVVTDESEELIDSVSQGIIDLAIVRSESAVVSPNLCSVQIAADHLVAYLPNSHPLAGEKEINLYDLRNETFLMAKANALSHTIGVKACDDAGFEPNILLQGSRSQIFSYLNRGLGVALLFGYPSQEPQGFTCVDIVPTPEVSINLVYRKDSLNHAAEKFLSFITKHLTDIQ